MVPSDGGTRSRIAQWAHAMLLAYGVFEDMGYIPEQLLVTSLCKGILGLIRSNEQKAASLGTKTWLTMLASLQCLAVVKFSTRPWMLNLAQKVLSMFASNQGSKLS